ncbi:MAG: BtrH N-terminal domain-containing protein [Methanomassiliicoccales archaeon]
MDTDLVIDGFETLGGKHCWSASARSVLNFHGIKMSEEMVFGLSGGLSFIYWYGKGMPAPFVGGRYGKGNEPIADTFRRMGGMAVIKETSSSTTALKDLVDSLRRGEPAIVFVDMAYLPYMMMPEDAHFGGHTIVVHGLGVDGMSTVSDRSVRPFELAQSDLQNARGSKFPPFQPKNRILQPGYPEQVIDLGPGIRESISNSCDSMIHPVINNFGLKGIRKWSTEVKKWPANFKGMALFGCLLNLFIYIEVGGTGGGAFRSMYADFLDESSCIIKEPELCKVGSEFRGCGKQWSEIAKAAMPDEWNSLAQARRLIVKKNVLFEREGPSAKEKILEINREMDSYLMPVINAEFDSMSPAKAENLMVDLSGRILDLERAEESAFRSLKGIVGEA